MVNILLWVLQVLGALVYGASGVMKVFMRDTISADLLIIRPVRIGATHA